MGRWRGQRQPVSRRPAEQVSGEVVNAKVGNEDAMGKHMEEAQVFGEYTGDAIPPELANKACEEEVSMLEVWDAWHVTTKEDA